MSRDDHPADRPDPVTLLARETVFQGHYRVDRYEVRHGLYGGGDGRPIRREVFERGHSVAVLPYDPVRDRVLLVEQFRVAPYATGERAWLIEAVAGVIDPGETPQAVARREAAEEAGLRLGELVPMFRCYVSPGGSTETLQLFAAPADLPDRLHGRTHGLAEEGEDIRVLLIDFRAAMAMVANGRIVAAPAIMALQWLALHRHGLRDIAG